jgi:hypothetical protein
MPVLIGGVIAAVVVAGGVGMALGANNNGPQPTTQGLPSAPPASAVVRSTPGPLVSLAPVPTSRPGTPTSRPATPAPVAPTPGTNVGNGGTISTDYLSITVPDTWEVGKQDVTYITLLTPAGGVLHIESGFLDDATTAEDLLSAEIQRRTSSNPDVETCIAKSEDPLPNGPDGVGIGLCYTATTSSGSTFPATLYLQYAVTDGGTTAYLMKILADDEDWEAVVDEVVGVFDSIQWKLYEGG